MEPVTFSTPTPEAPEPQSHIGNLIRRAQQLHLAAWARTVSADISSAQYSMLVVLERLGEASQQELCVAVDLDRSTVTDLVRRMERAGLITRTRSEEDARRNVVTLTDLGLAERHRLAPLVAQVQEELVGGLTPEAAEGLFHSLTQMLE